MIRIMLLDDEEMIRYGLQTIIGKYGNEFRVVGEAGDGYEGVRLINSLKPDIVVADIRMPKMNGIEFLKSVNDKNLNCKVVILTAYADFEYARSALKFGAVGFLLKPINEEELVAELRRIAMEKRTDDAGEDEDVIAKKLVGGILNSNNQLHPIVYKTLKYLEVNFKRDVSLHDLSSQLKVSPAYICKLFSENMDVSLVSFLNQLRINIAKELLAKKSCKIQEISEKMGFSSPKYFCKVFSDLVSMSPSEYSSKFS